MKIRIVTLVLALSCLSACGFMDSQLARDPATGESKLEQEVKAVAPVTGPYGALALSVATILTGIYGAFHAREANKQTDKLTA